jgi:hypothetical protein
MGYRGLLIPRKGSPIISGCLLGSLSGAALTLAGWWLCGSPLAGRDNWANAFARSLWDILASLSRFVWDVRYQAPDEISFGQGALLMLTNSAFLALWGTVGGWYVARLSKLHAGGRARTRWAVVRSQAMWGCAVGVAINLAFGLLLKLKASEPDSETAEWLFWYLSRPVQFILTAIGSPWPNLSSGVSISMLSGVCLVNGALAGLVCGLLAAGTGLTVSQDSTSAEHHEHY